MKNPTRRIWRDTLSLFRVRPVVGQIEVAVCVFVLFSMWLRVPDASALDVAGSVVLALLIIGIAGIGEAAIMLRLCGRARTLRLLLLGTGLLIVAVALWFGWSSVLDRLRGDDGLRAGYYNSRLPHGMRYVFTYSRILLWLGWMWNALKWAGAGILVAAVVCGVGSARPRRAMARVVRCGAYWIVLVVGAFAASMVTASLMDWVPGHGLRGEMLSLVLRLGMVIVFDAVAVCCLLCAIAACCWDVAEETDQSSVAGTPDESQPRTAENP